jgi:F-type H+-transporting ATPase subunit epsilon
MAPGDIKIVPNASGEGEVVANVDGGFLSVEHDRVTVVADRAAIGSGAAAH